MNQKEIKKIVSEMTLEEKAGMCSGKDNWHLKSVERLGIPEVMVSDGLSERRSNYPKKLPAAWRAWLEAIWR